MRTTDDGTTLIVDLIDGDDIEDASCPVCDEPYGYLTWEIGHGCARCGVGTDYCPTEGCDGSVRKFF